MTDSQTEHDPDVLAGQIAAAFGIHDADFSADADRPTTARITRGGTGRAPSPEAADQMLAILPNTPDGPFGLQDPSGESYNRYIKVTAAHHDAGGTLNGYLEWTIGDQDTNRSKWLNLDNRPPKSGFQNLKEFAAKYAPEAFATLNAELARKTFAPEKFDETDDIPAVPLDQGRGLGSNGKSPRDAALRDLDQRGIELWQSPERKPFATIGHENLPLSSHSGQRRIRGILADHGHVLSKTARGEVLDHLEARAAAGPIRPVFVRAMFDPIRNTLTIDLGDGTGRAVLIDGATGTWSVVTIPKDGPRFYRPASQAPLPVPLRDNIPDDFLSRLRRLTNLPLVVKRHNPSDIGVQADAAILLALASWIVPVGTAALMFVSGPNGTGKTSCARLLRGVTDPTAGDVARPPADARDLFVVARATLVLALDNMSELSGELADWLAVLLSGGDMPRRALYSDDDVVHLRARCGLIATTILADLISRADLADRAVSVRLAPIQTRRTEADLRAEFEREHPAMLAALLDALAAGIRDREAIEKEWAGKRLIRLLDAATVGEGMARSMGWPANVFIDAIERSRAASTDELLAADPVASAVFDLMTKDRLWRGTARQLLCALGFGGSASRDGRGPKNERGLTAALDRLEAPLRDRGITFAREKASTRERTRLLVLRRHGGGR